MNEEMFHEKYAIRHFYGKRLKSIIIWYRDVNGEIDYPVIQWWDGEVIDLVNQGHVNLSNFNSSIYKYFVNHVLPETVNTHG